jgi:hypothetical protein
MESLLVILHQENEFRLLQLRQPEVRYQEGHQEKPQELF